MPKMMILPSSNQREMNILPDMDIDSSKRQKEDNF
jgi:hypothetical protein